jgi:hypothetical protein
MTDTPRKYAIIVDGDSLDEAVEEAAHLLYLLLGRALRAHRRDHAVECGFEAFALETLAVLAKYRSVYSGEVPIPRSPPHL